MADTKIPETTGPAPGSVNAIDTPDRKYAGPMTENALGFRERSRAAVFACLMVVIAAAIPWLLGFDSAAVWFTAAVVVGVAATMFWIQGARREKFYAAKIFQLRDISRQWEERWRLLRDDSQQTSTALAQMADGVIVLSEVGNILLINPAARRLLFLEDATAYVGRRLTEIARHPIINDLVTHASSGATDCVDSIEVTDGKAVRPLNISINRIELAGTAKLLLILRDETESRRVEHIRREFVANVSHELKTPLAAIKGYAETVELAIQDDPESASHFMKQILSQCVRLERLVSDMMQLARAQDGTRNMTFVRLPLRKVIADAFRSCRPIAESKQIELLIGDVPDDAVVIADGEATLTIVNNLISNAVRYTPVGGHVEISTESRERFVAIVVKDDGVGIHESEQARIFERFYRVEKTRESAGGGTGIGLSIVKNLALAQQGNVELSSRPGKGSTFRVLLPAAKAR